MTLYTVILQGSHGGHRYVARVPVVGETLRDPQQRRHVVTGVEHLDVPRYASEDIPVAALTLKRDPEDAEAERIANMGRGRGART